MMGFQVVLVQSFYIQWADYQKYGELAFYLSPIKMQHVLIIIFAFSLRLDDIFWLRKVGWTLEL